MWLQTKSRSRHKPRRASRSRKRASAPRPPNVSETVYALMAYGEPTQSSAV
jgi:hypothetical protein